MNQIKVVTLNAWGLLYISKDVEERMEALAKELSKGSFDIVCLQEIWCSRHYNMLVEQTKEVLPFSHYFRSGFLGTGCAVLSRYQILDTYFQKFLHNGYFWTVNHGDWYAGKGVGCAILKHPKQNIHLFNTHLHADYGGLYLYKECRSLQIYETTQLIRHVTRPGDAVILCGDFNHNPAEFGIKALTDLAIVYDSYDVAKQKPLPENTLTLNPIKNKYNDPTKDDPSRIDYIFINDAFDCSSCELTLDEIPGTSLRYSDHTGYTVTLSFKENVEDIAHKDTAPYETLKELWEVIKDGEELSKEIVWKNLLIVLLFLFLFAFLPLFAGDLFHRWIPPSNTWFGKVMLIIQILTIVVSAFYLLGVVLVNRQVDVNAYQNISDSIKIRLKSMNDANGKKHR